MPNRADVHKPPNARLFNPFFYLTGEKMIYTTGVLDALKFVVLVTLFIITGLEFIAERKITLFDTKEVIGRAQWVLLITYLILTIWRYSL